MALFTIILEYRKGTYIRQVRGASPISAWRKAVGQFDFLSPSAKRRLTNEADPVVTVEGKKRVWCITASLRGGLALAHIIETVE